MFDVLIREAAARFGLGDKAGPLLKMLLAFMTDKNTGGLAGFLEKFKEAGLGPTIQTWLGGGPSARAISNEDLDKALGADGGVIEQLVRNLGAERENVTSALGYLTPTLVGKLTPGGSIPSSIPSDIAALADEGRDLLSGADAAAASATGAGGSGIGKWLPWLVLALAVLLGLGYCSTRNKVMEESVPAVSSSPAAVTDDDSAAADEAAAPAAEADEGAADTAAADDDDAGAEEADAAAVDAEPEDAIAAGAADAGDEPDAATDAEPADVLEEDASGAAADADETDESAAADAADEPADEPALGDGSDVDVNDADAEGADEAGAGETDEANADEVDSSDILDQTGAVPYEMGGQPAVTVYFDSGQTEVDPQFAQQSQALVAYLQEHPDAVATIAGYTDATGNAEINARISRDRAKAVQAALIMAGVEEGQTDLVKPEAVESQETGANASSRRVEVMIR